MAVGKNKRISKGKKDGKKKLSIRSQRKIGMTSRRHQPSTRDRWARLLSQEPKEPRVFEVSLANLQQDEDQAFRKIKFRAEDVQGRNGMDFTTDKLQSLVRKWQSLIESHVDVKTTDNYMLCIFCIGFTKKRPNRIKRTCYAQSSEICQELVAKFIPEVIGKEIEKATSGIYPLQNTYIRKVKILKAPKFDLTKLMEAHGDYSEEIGAKIEQPVGDDAEMDGEPVEVPGA
ncbi:unnamed protein product [Sphagnum jensenii]|uniref:40S ribosomal protein S3a n=1 Tax=Sphagnum jensenii TaxID=128206 RepID=A0ABP1BDZ1_9BRYO